MVVNEQVETARERKRKPAWMVAMVIVSAGGSLARLWEDWSTHWAEGNSPGLRGNSPGRGQQ